MIALGYVVDADNPFGALRLYEGLGCRTTDRTCMWEWAPQRQRAAQR